MVKINFKSSAILIFLITGIFAYTGANAMAEPEYIYGQVVYSDDQKPVSFGLIKVFKTNNPGNVGRILEVADIQSNGVFKLSKQNIQNTDGIKIMAYVNDVDNLKRAFETTVVEAGKVLTSSDGEYAMIIKVDRTSDDESNSSDDAKTENIDMDNFLQQNYPNPFNPTTSIRIELPQTSKVTVKIYNMSGETVATLVDNKSLTKGTNEFEFNAGNLPSGIYVYTLNSGSYSETRKMMLLK